MADLTTPAWVVRWAAESMAHNLRFIGDEKLTWKPTPESKSASQVVGEAAGVMKMSMPLFEGGTFAPAPFPEPQTVEEGIRLLNEAAEPFAAALEKAGPELDVATETPFGTMWASRGIIFGMIDLIHHHGQITYIQGLLGDAENHTDWQQVLKWFGPQQ